MCSRCQPLAGRTGSCPRRHVGVRTRASRCIFFFFSHCIFLFSLARKRNIQWPGPAGSGRKRKIQWHLPAGRAEKERYNGIAQLAQPKKIYNDIAEPAKNKNSSGRRLDTVFPLYGEFTEKDTMTAAQKRYNDIWLGSGKKKDTMGLASWPSRKKRCNENGCWLDLRVVIVYFLFRSKK